MESRSVAIPMETSFLKTAANDSIKLSYNFTYRKAIGSLLYLATVPRPDIGVAVGNLCRFVESPTERD